ncbi:MAG: hypothetical protein H6719_36495 [Sandaracinaceae bacterium]|nr:hypothetical protein [Sandaracinaceae bacterium]
MKGIPKTLGALVFPASSEAGLALHRLVGDNENASVDTVLRAASARGIPIDVYTYVCRSALLDALAFRQEPNKQRGRLLLRHPGGFDESVAHRLPPTDKKIRVIQPPETPT